MSTKYPLEEVSKTLPGRSRNSYLPPGYANESTATVTARFSRR